MFTWHYGYWRPFRRIFMVSVCDNVPRSPGNGVTVNRGDVNCETCLEMMGPS